MTLAEILSSKGGIFDKYFVNLYPSEYKAIFAETPAKYLDTYTLLTFGGRTVLPAAVARFDEFVTAVIDLGVNQWVRLAAAMRAEYDATKPLMSETSQVSEGTTDNADNSETLNAVKAFDDTELIDSQRDKQSTNKSQNERHSITSNQYGLGVNRNYRQLIQDEKELREVRWQQDIINQIVTSITLQVWK